MYLLNISRTHSYFCFIFKVKKSQIFTSQRSQVMLKITHFVGIVGPESLRLQGSEYACSETAKGYSITILQQMLHEGSFLFRELHS
jgi:hypothetical protein